MADIDELLAEIESDEAEVTHPLFDWNAARDRMSQVCEEDATSAFPLFDVHIAHVDLQRGVSMAYAALLDSEHIRSAPRGFIDFHGQIERGRERYRYGTPTLADWLAYNERSTRR